MKIINRTLRLIYSNPKNKNCIPKSAVLNKN